MYESGENYLETILMLHQKQGYVRSIDTVSYTHLDVYKRQLLTLSDKFYIKKHKLIYKKKNCVLKSHSKT